MVPFSSFRFGRSTGLCDSTDSLDSSHGDAQSARIREIESLTFGKKAKREEEEAQTQTPVRGSGRKASAPENQRKERLYFSILARHVAS